MNIKPYIELARIDHWFKNAFMVVGILMAVFYQPGILGPGSVAQLALAVLATCIVASSNYVLNEILDAPTDREHPSKVARPIPAGRAAVRVAWLEWLLLSAAGLCLAFQIGVTFGLAALSLWTMALIYNVPPVRTKEVAYLDVLTESVNNPIRLLLGWFALLSDRLPPVSLLLSYWAVGAFFMAAKRFAELRTIGDRTRAARYRRSFERYDEHNLLASMFFYVAVCAFFGGIFIVRCKLELVLCVPLIAGLFTYYLRLGLRNNSPVQAPEKLYRERGFFLYGLVCFLCFAVLLFTHIPSLYELFRVQAPGATALWTIG